MVWMIIFGIPLAVAQEVSAPASGRANAELPLGLHSALSVGVDFQKINTIQWYFEDKAIPGATNRILRFHPAVRENSGRYFVVGTGAAGSFTGQTAIVTVKAFRPTIEELGPARQDVGPGQPVWLSLVVSGAPSPAVQWFRNGELLAGETNRTLFLPRVSANQAGRFHALATNEAGTDTSEAFLVTVRPAPPTWSRLPIDKEAVEDTLVVMTSEAVGGPPPRYQWRKGGVNLPGQTNSALFLPRARKEDTGNYEITASNDAGEISATNRLSVRAGNGLDHWTWRQPRPQGSGLLALARGVDRWVAAGNLGGTVVLRDGGDWQASRVPGECTITHLLYAGGRFLGSGTSSGPDFHQVIVTSVDGFDWTVASGPNPAGAFAGIAYGEGRFVATSSRPEVFALVSADGSHWTTQDARPFGGGKVAWGNGRFVVSDAGGRLHASVDGEAWEKVIEVDGFGAADLHFAGGRFLARYGDFGAISEDGLHWSFVDYAGFGVPTSITFGRGKFIAGGHLKGGAFGTSKDGITWTTSYLGADSRDVRAVGFEQGKFVAVGEGGLTATSTDGVIWIGGTLGNQADLTAVIASGSVLVAVGDDGTILTSANGNTWTAPNERPTSKDLFAIAAGNGQFLAGGENGVVLSSKDGARWVRGGVGLAMSDHIGRLFYAERRWIALGLSAGYATSPDGETWTAAPGAAASFTSLSGFASGNGVAVLSSREPRVPLRYSTDGINWTPADPGFPEIGPVDDVAFGNGLFVATARAGIVLCSTNGVSWSRQPAPPMIRMRYASGLFLGTDVQGRLGSSPDGVHWTFHRTAKGQVMNDLVVCQESTVVVIGNNRSIQQSADFRPRLTGAEVRGGEMVLSIDPGPYEPALRVETTPDFREWRRVAGFAGESLRFPWSSNPPTAFFRLAIP
jgi:hypothetical protein